MPRIAGQIDQAKREAIIEAASTVLSTRGWAAPMEVIARHASVSKQTIYNHFGNKAELIRALVAHRVASITAPLRDPELESRPEEALVAYARSLLKVLTTKSSSLMRVSIQSAGEMPELAQEVFEAGPAVSLAKLASFLELETRRGWIAVDDPLQAAEFFSGMVAGHRQTRALLGVGQPMTDQDIDLIAKAATRRFIRAYAP